VSITTLYRFYNTADELLYVGISEKGPERWKAHRKDKPWWTDVARTTTEHYDTRTEALDAERAAIIAEHPKHNVVHNRPPSPKPSYPVTPTAVSDLWAIESCIWCDCPPGSRAIAQTACGDGEETSFQCGNCGLRQYLYRSPSGKRLPEPYKGPAKLLRITAVLPLAGVGRTKLYEMFDSGEIETVHLTPKCRRVVAASYNEYALSMNRAGVT
jgi:predicted GIY-YIG superfamily endonuclease